MQHDKAIELLKAEIEIIGREIAAAEKEALSLEDKAKDQRRYVVDLAAVTYNLKRAISILETEG